MGYAAGTGQVRQVIEKMTMIQQYTFVCAPTPFQKAAIAALDVDMSGYIADYKKKRDMAVEGMSRAFDLGYVPAGAFYMFVKTPAWAADSTEFVKKAIENNVLVIPGNVFSEKDTHFRMCYTTTNDKIEQGIEILCSLAKG
jgi:aspartate aminotransferase/aminotransferase